MSVWQLVKAERDGDILLEVSDAVRESLIADMDDHELIAAAKELGGRRACGSRPRTAAGCGPRTDGVPRCPAA
ncbi:magnesium transporter MgtE N-terminal domain-containing protein [Azotobacter vinelandii]